MNYTSGTKGSRTRAAGPGEGALQETASGGLAQSALAPSRHP